MRKLLIHADPALLVKSDGGELEVVVIEQEWGTGEICQQVLVSSCWLQRSAMIVSVSSYV